MRFPLFLSVEHPQMNMRNRMKERVFFIIDCLMGIFNLYFLTMPQILLSIVIPIYNEEPVIVELNKRLQSLLNNIASAFPGFIEVIFIDDGSQDKSLEMLRGIASQESRYRVISLSRNFGHQNAITAGMDHAQGEAVVVIDADLQDPPEVILEMLQKWKVGFDIVYAIRSEREGESLFKRLTASLFYRFMRKMIGIKMPLDAGDFRLMSRRVILTLHALRESNRFVRGLVAWTGFKSSSIYYKREKRFAGTTKYPLRKMIKFAFDGITTFSTIPLRAATWLGLFSGLVALVAAGWAVYEKFFGEGVIQGWTTIMLAVALGSSAQLLMIGILGEYIGRIFDEVKRRPLYLISEQINLKPPSKDIS